jgi:Domain of unknown function (DUF1338)
MKKPLTLSEMFEHMWQDYCHINPQAQAVRDALLAAGEPVINDHIAFRTFTNDKVGVDQLALHFTKFGYKVAGEYKFAEKKLNAKHYEHPDESQPKVFISELDLNLVSPFARETFEGVAHQFGRHAVEDERFLFAGRPWTAHYKTYLKLAEESEYAAWLYAHGYRPNHFTIYI